MRSESRQVDPIFRELPPPRLALRSEHRLHRLAHRHAFEDPDLRMRQQLQPLELAACELFVRAAEAPVLIRIRAITLGVEEPRLHRVRRALDRVAHERRIRVVPRDHRIEPVIELRVRPYGVQSDAMAQSAQTLDRRLSLPRREVVEDRLPHEEVRRPRVVRRLELRELQRRVEREVDVVPQQDVARLWIAIKERKAVAALPRRVEQLSVMHKIECAAHPTSTSSSLAAASARSSASRFVSATAIT